MVHRFPPRRLGVALLLRSGIAFLAGDILMSVFSVLCCCITDHLRWIRDCFAGSEEVVAGMISFVGCPHHDEQSLGGLCHRPFVQSLAAKAC
eukprot:1159635-Pelagomonas_calceolata.AAC.8